MPLRALQASPRWGRFSRAQPGETGPGPSGLRASLRGPFEGETCDEKTGVRAPPAFNFDGLTCRGLTADAGGGFYYCYAQYYIISNHTMLHCHVVCCARLHCSRLPRVLGTAARLPPSRSSPGLPVTPVPQSSTRSTSRPPSWHDCDESCWVLSSVAFTRRDVAKQLLDTRYCSDSLEAVW